MKKTLLLTFAALAFSGTTFARKWTSSDGAKTFTGDYVSSDAESVTVLRNGKQVSFKLALLSDDDKAWIKAEAAKADNAKAAADFAESDFGKSFKKLQKLNGKKFAKHKLEAAPKFFILYFSASW